MNKIRSNVRFKVKSSPSYVINILAKEGIKVKDIQSVGVNVAFSINDKDSKRAENILQGYNREYTIIEKSGIANFARDLLRRFGIWISLIVVAVGALLYSFYAMDIEINGLDRLDSALVYQVLDDNSVTFPIAKKNIDIENLKKDIADLQGVSLCDIRLRGHLIEINILEELPKPSIKEVVLDKPIVSRYDAQVTRVVVLAGTAKVEKGDSVKAGAVLIEPFYILGDNQDVKIQSGADGYVYGKVWYTKSYVFNQTIIETQRTGNVQRKVDFHSPLFKTNQQCTFELFEKESVQGVIFCPLPIKVNQVTYYELKSKERTFIFEEEKDSILAKAYLELDELLPEDAEVARKWYIAKTLDKSTILDIYYEVEQIINSS